MALQLMPDLVIPAGQSLSNTVNCEAGRVVRIITPTDWTRAPLSFQLSMDGTKFNDLVQIPATEGDFRSRHECRRYRCIPACCCRAGWELRCPGSGFALARVRNRSSRKRTVFSRSCCSCRTHRLSSRVRRDLPVQPGLLVRQEFQVRLGLQARLDRRESTTPRA